MAEEMVVMRMSGSKRGLEEECVLGHLRRGKCSSDASESGPDHPGSARPWLYLASILTQYDHTIKFSRS